MAKFQDILDAKKVNPKWNNRDIVRFHYFNENGAVAAKRASDERIYAAVEAGLCKAGAIFAYGGMNNYHEEKMRGLLDARRVSSFDARYHPAEIYNQIKETDAFLNDIPDSAKPRVVAELEGAAK